MHRIDTAYATVANLFTEGNPAVGEPATRISDDWLNDLQEEICNVIEAAGITLDKGVRNQLLRAIKNAGGERVSVLSHYSGSGDFDAAVHAAYDEVAAKGGGTVWFPWRMAGYTLNDYQLVEHPNINFAGDDAEIIYKWSAASQGAGLVGGTFKASPAFLIKSSAGNNKFCGLRFRQYAGFPTTYNTPVGYNSAATFAAIIVQGADHVDIQGCRFDIDTGRAAYWRGGNYGKFGNNVLIESSVVAHIGEVSSALFWDATDDISVRYSPWCLSVFNNKIIGSNTTRLASHSIFMTGVVAPNVADNHLYGLGVDGAGGGDGIRIYANDLGLFNQDGTARTKHQMLVRGNHIFGTVSAAINFTGDSALGPDSTACGAISSNNIDVIGAGIYVERGMYLKISSNDIISTSSPLVLADSCEGLNSTKNKYECVGTGESGRTIACRSTLQLTNAWFVGDTITSNVDDVYAFDTSTAALGFENGGIKNCTFVFKSTTTSSRILQLSESSGSVYCDCNVFDVRAAGINNRYLVSIDEAAAVNTTVYFRGNKATSANGTSYVSRGVAINNSDACFISDNDVGNVHVICSGKAFVHDNKITNGVASVVALIVENAQTVYAHDNDIEQTVTSNVMAAEFIACGRTKFHSNTARANTTTVLVRATTSGTIEASKNDYYNANTGAPVGVTGTAKIEGDLGAYFNREGAGTQWSDANRVAASSCLPGTAFWNSTDNAPNFSDGTNWRTAAGVVT